MARGGEADAQHLVPGFPDLDSANAYAEARTRASLEKLRAEGQDPAELKRLWQLYGEDCCVVGNAFAASAKLDRFIAEPASEGLVDWPALSPERLGLTGRRFHVAALVIDQQNRSVWVGGFLTWPERPANEALFNHFHEAALGAFANQGIRDADPVSLHVTQIHELPHPPRPPADQPLSNWLVEVDFVCHGVEFGVPLDAVFAWPEEPSGEALDAMTHVMMADALSVRGDGPSWASESEIRWLVVKPTSDPPTYPAG